MGNTCRQEVGRANEGVSTLQPCFASSMQGLTMFQCCPFLEWMSILRDKWSSPKRSVWKSLSFFFFFGDKVSPCLSGCPETCFVGYAWTWSDFPVTKDMSVPQPQWLFSMLEAEVTQALSLSFEQGDLRSTQKLHSRVILTLFHMLWIPRTTKKNGRWELKID